MLSSVSTPNKYSQMVPDPEDDDRREYRRLPMDGTVLVIPREEPVERFWATTGNISRGGMFVHTVMKLPLDAELRARIHLTDGPVVRAQARVVREEEGRGFGCYFTSFTSDAARDLDRWLGPSGGLDPVAGTID